MAAFGIAEVLNVDINTYFIVPPAVIVAVSKDKKDLHCGILSAVAGAFVKQTI
jgi:hypothetical protein